jgi:hypothetical protein
MDDDVDNNCYSLMTIVSLTRHDESNLLSNGRVEIWHLQALVSEHKNNDKSRCSELNAKKSMKI